MKLLLAALATAVFGAVIFPAVLLAAVVGALGPAPPSGPGPVAGIPPDALAAYEAAAVTCPGLSWSVLAGIGEVESDHGRSTAPGVHSGANPWGAEGPMQFLPATFREYARPRPDGRAPSPYDIGDATMAAATLLCANGGGDGARLRNAIWNYNHDWGYVDLVLSWASRYRGG